MFANNGAIWLVLEDQINFFKTKVVLICTNGNKLV